MYLFFPDFWLYVNSASTRGILVTTNAHVAATAHVPLAFRSPSRTLGWKARSSPVRTLEFAGPLLLTLLNTQKAFTLPENAKDHPLDICIVSWALAAAGQSSVTATNNSARRFIRESLLRECTCSIKPLVPC